MRKTRNIRQHGSGASGSKNVNANSDKSNNKKNVKHNSTRKHKLEYIVEESSAERGGIDDLVKKVNNRLSEGYTLQGGISGLADGGDFIYVQALTK